MSDGSPDPGRAEREPAGPSRPDATAIVIVPRWIQLVMLPLAIVGLWALARAAGPVLLVFVIAAVVALILNPIVSFAQRGRVPRGAAVFGVYIGLLLVVVLVGALLANPVADQVSAFRDDVPAIVDGANQSLVDVQTWLDDQGINVEVQHQGETALETLQRNVLKGSGSVVTFGRDLLQTIVETSFALILILVISIYMLIYGERIGRVVRSIMPPGDGTPDDDFPHRAQKAVSRYVGGQLAFSLIMGASAAIGLWVLGAVGIFPDGQRYALFFGAFFGLMELIPYLGPFLGAAPAIIVALFQDPLTAVWVALFFLALQQLEGHVVAPQVFGQALRINPLVVIFALLLGAQLYGIVGALLALPIAAIGRETVLYLRRHLVLEAWGPVAPTVMIAGPTPPARAGPAVTDGSAERGGDPSAPASAEGEGAPRDPVAPG